MDYLKLFQTHEEYEAFVSGGTMVRPNVSHCVQENEVHYNSIVIMTVKYNVTNTSNPTPLYFYMIHEGATMFDKVVIDDIEVSIADIDTAHGTYQFSTLGEHTVKYTLKDPTIIGEEAFGDCSSLISVTIPNSVTTIGVAAFAGCTNLTSIIIPNSVTNIGGWAFSDCSGLTSVTIGNSVTSIGRSAFQDCYLDRIDIGSGVTTIGGDNNGGTFRTLTITAINPPLLTDGYFLTEEYDGNDSLSVIQVPAESVNAYKTASGWSDYSEIIQAIPTT